MFSRFSRVASAAPRLAMRASTRTSGASRIAKSVIGGATIIGVFGVAEVHAMPEAEGGMDMQKVGMIGGAAVLLVAGVGYFMMNQDDSKNVAFVFIKPHACTEPAKELVRAELTKRGIAITGEGTILGTVIDEKKYIDQHYYAIASKATLLEPKDLPVPADKFEAAFGVAWKDALHQGIVFNAMQACQRLNISSDDLDKKWAAAKKAKKLVKFGGGFYCGDIDGLYVFNGFFMSMRAKFTGDAKIHYFKTEFSADDLKWEDFRGKVLGPTDPAEAPADSIRGLVAANWKSLGLSAPCNVGDNGVHASASPYEALAEFNNWLETGPAAESFGRRMIAAGISKETIKFWGQDPQVKYIKDGKEGKGSLWDLVEDMDSAECLETLKMVNDYAATNRA
jgi:hypothetical protein